MKLREDLVLRQVDQDYLIVDPGQDMIDMSKVYTLNETAAFLWNSLQGKEVSIDIMVDIICSTYDVTPDIARADATILFEEFKAQGILVEC